MWSSRWGAAIPARFSPASATRTGSSTTPQGLGSRKCALSGTRSRPASASSSPNCSVLRRPMSEHAYVVVIGGGQAGLAAGYYLRRAGLNFVILDRQDRAGGAWRHGWDRSEEHTSELQSRGHLVCRLLLEKK